MSQRHANLEKLTRQPLDVLVIGGGINGAVSAASLSASGLRVGIIDSRDFAGFTSQHSSNLVWGGIKYLESLEFDLVNDLCQSRNELLDAFPSTVKEIRFLTTLSRGFRFTPFMLYLGAWLYWWIGRRRTQKPKWLSKRRIKAMEPNIDVSSCAGGIEYSDAYLHDNDARFVFNFVRKAMDNGACAVNYLEAITTTFKYGHWLTEVRDNTDGRRYKIRTKYLVNAAGAFTDRLNAMSGVATEHRNLYSKGIHLIVPGLTNEKRVLAFFADDGRLFFAVPMAHRTCIGTTDTQVDSPDTDITTEDRDFVLSNINDMMDLSPPLTPDDIIAERCGVRALAVKRKGGQVEDSLQLSREHHVEVNAEEHHVSIFGGKLTDCLNVSEEVREAIASMGATMHAPVQGWYGEPSDERRREFNERASALRVDELVANDTGEQLSERLWRRYGEDAFAMLEAIDEDAAMAEVIIEGSGIRRCEIEHIADNELIVKLEDLLRRRSKLEQLVSMETLQASTGLREVCDILFGDQAQLRYDEYFAEQ